VSNVVFFLRLAFDVPCAVRLMSLVNSVRSISVTCLSVLCSPVGAVSVVWGCPASLTSCAAMHVTMQRLFCLHSCAYVWQVRCNSLFKHVPACEQCVNHWVFRRDLPCPYSPLAGCAFLCYLAIVLCLRACGSHSVRLTR
jgi:hypothetical protein